VDPRNEDDRRRDQDSLPTPTPDEAEALIRQVFGDVVEEPW
jgi:hypothetical protein